MKVLLYILIAASAQAGMVRTLVMNSSKSEMIHLCLGRSTVLRFQELPKKIIIGNKNYFDLEFIERDVAIQPLKAVNSNLFVYGSYGSYAFNLSFLPSCRYDDLVKIVGSSENKTQKRISFILRESIKVSVEAISRAALAPHIGIIDLSFLMWEIRGFQCRNCTLV